MRIINNILATPFGWARKYMARTFRKDPNFRRVYIANISMAMYDYQMNRTLDGDAIDFSDKRNRDDLANKIMNLIFS